MATRVRSDEAEWLRISNQWNSTETTTMVDYFKIGLPSANRVIAAANTIGMPLSIDITEHDISELERRRQLMAETTGNAFKEINEILDDKFVLGLKAVLDKAYALNPCDFTMDKTDPTGRVTSFGLDMLISSMLSKVNPKLQEDFQKKAEALNEDKVPKSLGEIIAAAMAEALKRLKDGKPVEEEKEILGYLPDGQPIYAVPNMTPEQIQTLKNNFIDALQNPGAPWGGKKIGDYDGMFGLQCVDLPDWYINNYTTLKYGNGDGGQVVNNLITANPGKIDYEPANRPPRVGSIFSTYDPKYGASGTNPAGHTGIVVTVNGDQITTIDTYNGLWDKGNGKMVETYPLPDKNGTPTTITWSPSDFDKGTKFVYVGGYLKQ